MPWLKVVIFLECSSGASLFIENTNALQKIGLPAHHGVTYPTSISVLQRWLVWYSIVQFSQFMGLKSVPPWKIHIQNGRKQIWPLPKRKTYKNHRGPCDFLHPGIPVTSELRLRNHHELTFREARRKVLYVYRKFYRKFIHTLKRMFKSPSRSLVLVHFQWPKAALVSRQVAAEKLNNSNIVSILRIFLMVSTNPFFSKILQARQILPTHLRLPTNSSLRWPVLSPVTGKQLWGFNGEVSTATFWVNTVSN